MSSFKVRGLSELDRALVELGSRAGRQALVESLRYAARPIRKTARRNVKKRTGTLSESIGIRTFKGKGATSNVAKVQIGVFGRDAWYGRLLERGTKKHKIPSRQRDKKGRLIRISIGGKVYSSANHPGTKAKPFLLPAFESEHRAATRLFAKRLREKIILKAIRYGIH